MTAQDAPAGQAGHGPVASSPSLEVRGLTVDFGGVRAVDDIAFTVGRGELVGLIGPNGAGKTTTIDAVTGFVRCRGHVQAGGRRLDGLAPHRRVAAGVTRTWQSLELFDDLTVLENCIVGGAHPGMRRWWPPSGARKRRSMPAPPRDAHALEVLAQLGLDTESDRPTSQLSLGQRKLAAVARALVAQPAVVLLDEPAAGLDTTESQALGRQLRAVVDSGTSMLLVDHDMHLILGICDRVVVLEFGRVIAEGRPDEVRADPRVVEAYLGAAHR